MDMIERIGDEIKFRGFLAENEISLIFDEEGVDLGDDELEGLMSCLYEKYNFIPNDNGDGYLVCKDINALRRFLESINISDRALITRVELANGTIRELRELI